jgi:hypothetical protein
MAMLFGSLSVVVDCCLWWPFVLVLLEFGCVLFLIEVMKWKVSRIAYL